MISPLVEDGPLFLRHQMADPILAEDGTAALKQQTVDAVIDFTIDVVGAPCKHHDRPSTFSGLLYNDGCLVSYRLLVGSHGHVAPFACQLDFTLAKIVVLGEYFIEP